MNPPCAQCSKTVYPMEKLNCLDKNWHKACFKCEVCNMTLNMKTYKGYNKRPYCSAHYPTTKHTTVADTPENRRIGKQQSLTSGVKYHADFEKQKGNSYSTVTDDPETLRVRRNDPQLSDLSYQGAGPPESRRQTTPGEHPMLPPETWRQMIPGEHPMPQTAQQQLGTLMDPTHGMESMTIQDGHDRMMQQQHEEEQRHLASMRRQENPPISIQSYQQVRLKPGKIEDYDPMTHPDAQQPKFEAPAAVSEPEPTIQSGQNVMRAVFDYTAAEDDEISFADGDVIVNCVKIDDGWMTGTVQRTGQSGMLPANYVEPIS